MKYAPIQNLKELQKLMPSIIKDYGEDQKITHAALANPILALEHIGYELTPDFKYELEFLIRFGEKKGKALLTLEKKIFKEVNKEFDLRSPDQLFEVLKPILKLKAPAGKASKKAKETTKKAPKKISITSLTKAHLSLPPQLKWTEKVKDVLLDCPKKHPAIPLILKYRELESSEPRLASRQLFEKALKGKLKKSFTLNNIRFRLKKRNA